MLFSRSRSLLSIVMLCCCLMDFCIVSAEQDEYKIVKTKYGDVRGKLLKTLFDDGKYFAFQGIPYAKSPVNELRFKVKRN